VRVVLVGGGVQPIPPTGYGAVERIIADLAAELGRQGHSVEILNQVRHGRTRDEIPFALSVPHQLRTRTFDVVHAHTPVVANRLAGAGIPFVYTSHSRHWYYRRGITHRWGYWLERRAVRRSAAVIALTEPLAATMRAAVRPPLPPLAVIPFGVDAERYRPDWEARTGTRALGVGVVAPFKRWHLAARATRATGLSLAIAGPIADATYAEAVRREGEHVRLLGEIPDTDLRAEFARSDFLIHPSAVEVLSATVLQALAAGLPVLGGSAVAGVVEPDLTGWIVDDRDENAFITGLRERAQQLASDPALRRRVGVAARSAAETRFSWPAIAARHVDVYRGTSAPRRT
jgi:glycosyltransferase involved in cell wall biosynthesis